MHFRPEPRARSPLEHMVHQCMSEDAWMSGMLGIPMSQPVLPADESRLGFIRHYALCSAERQTALDAKPDAWFEETTKFFDADRTRAWILTRRFTHSAHHRGQLTVYLRLWGQSLYSTYGPSADTGGLPKNGARVLYRYSSIEELIAAEERGGDWPELPDIGNSPVTERPDR
jgi:hypothetical protein